MISKHITNLFFLSFIFLVFFISTFAQEVADNFIITVDYCELVKNPNFYNGKKIRVSGIYERGFEKSNMYGENCRGDKFLPSYETWVSNFYNRKYNCSDIKTQKIIKTFFSERIEYELKVTFIGIFQGSDKSGGFGHLSGYKYHLIVNCVEKAQLLPLERNGCKRVDNTKAFHTLQFVHIENGFAPAYDKKTKNKKTQELVKIKLINNSTCPVKIPIYLTTTDTKELKDQEMEKVIYQLSARSVKKKSKMITDSPANYSILNPENSIFFTVPLRYFLREHYDVRIAFDNAENDKNPQAYYQPFYFSVYDLPEKLRDKIKYP